LDKNFKLILTCVVLAILLIGCGTEKVKVKIIENTSPTNRPIKEYEEKRTAPPNIARIIPGYNNVDETETIEKKMLTEEEAYRLFSVKNFYNISYTFDNEGNYLGNIKLSNLTDNIHPTYQCYYHTEDGSMWNVYVINDSMFASLVQLEYDDTFEEEVIVSEQEEVLSYNSITNTFGKVIPQGEKIIKVNNITADFLSEVSKSIVEATTPKE